MGQKKATLIICGFLLVLSIDAQISTTGCYLSGALIDPSSTAGCGNTPNYCDLASVWVPVFSPMACGTSVVTGGVAYARSQTWGLGATCTATVVAEYRKRNNYGAPVNPSGTGCSNCGMDGSPDGFQITQTGGVISSQSSTIDVNVGTCAAYPALGTYTTAVATVSPGCNNADATVMMILTGGAFTIGGTSNRADEIFTYTINLSCGAGCTSVLPIELINFSGHQEGDQIDLVWDIATEKNVNYYLVERSTDGINFSVLGTVKAKNITSRTSYYLTDEKPAKGINYYRLTNIDTDGAVGKPNLIALEMEKDLNNAWYDQDDERIIFYYNESLAKETIQLMDLTGKVLKEIDLFAETNIFHKEISKQDIPSGMYLFRSLNGIKPLNMKLIIN